MKTWHEGQTRQEPIFPMNTCTAEILARLNRDFYERNASSFSRTRQSPWPGWERVLDITGQPASVLDLASGNMRFLKYMAQHFPNAAIQQYCVDSCDALAQPDEGVAFQHLDIARCLYTGNSLAEALEAPACELCTSFGFMHHVYGQPARIELARALMAKTLPGGHVALSFWQFANSDELRGKASVSTEEGLKKLDVELEEGDYLLGWDGVPGEYRYCHSFAASELDEIAQAVAGETEAIVRFESDGRTKNMNAYLVLTRN